MIGSLSRVVLLLATVTPLLAEKDPAADFIAAARTATARYHDQAVAIADGYRLIGTDFPAMGEHWIRIGLLFDSEINPSRPEILSYASVNGTPRLLGAAYVAPLLAGESAPDWPVSHELWHDHFRTLEAETTRPQHHTGGHAADASKGARMAMIHAWIWLDNPEGIFAADNWAIPYLRLGLNAPPNVSTASAKALALTSGASSHFVASIRAAAEFTPAERKKIDAAFASARLQVENLARGITPPTPSQADIEKLASVWESLWKQIDSSVSAKHRPALHHVPVR